jgi:hypothetical protein
MQFGDRGLIATWRASGPSAPWKSVARRPWLSNEHSFFCWALAKLREAQAPLWSLANFQAVFANLTGEDARPTLWCGRPRPRSGRCKRLPSKFFGRPSQRWMPISPAVDCETSSGPQSSGKGANRDGSLTAATALRSAQISFRPDLRYTGLAACTICYPPAVPVHVPSNPRYERWQKSA